MGTLWGHLGTLWGHLGDIWGHAPLGRLHLGRQLPLQALLLLQGLPGGVMGGERGFGALWGPFGDTMGTFWGHLRTLWGPFEDLWET